MKSTILAGAAMAALMTLAPAVARAATVSDASGDFLASYTGPQNGDLDILSAGASFDGTNFHLAALMNGAIGTTSNVLHVFGVDRGSGTARFAGLSPSVGAGILFDAVVVLFPGSVVRVVDFQPAGPPIITQLGPTAATINGAGLDLLVPLSLLSTRGFAPPDYGFSMWTRHRINIAMDSGNFEIGDFAPDAATFRASIPEPASWAMMILGLGAVGGALRRRRPVAVAA